MTGPGADHGVRRAAFGPLVLTFDDRVLEPREWTLAQSQWAAELLSERVGTAAGVTGSAGSEGAVLELCAGVGHIGLAAVAGSRRALVCVDASPVACAFARDNVAANATAERPAELTEVREGDLREAVADHERFALVIADPPYLPSADTGRFPADPLLAIDGGADGLDLAWTCLEVAERHLLPGGSVLLQLADTAQCDVVEAAWGTRHGLVPVDRRVVGRGALLRLDRA